VELKLKKFSVKTAGQIFQSNQSGIETRTENGLYKIAQTSNRTKVELKQQRHGLIFR